MLELKNHKTATFATLTYGELPEGASLKPSDVQKFLKRLRKKGHEIRYFAVGEYGDVTQRPHYHLVIFGYPNCDYGRSRYTKKITSCCGPCDEIQETWGLGHVLLGEANEHSLQYVAGYVVKKMTNAKNPKVLEWLNGRNPEFARMSLKPGIGANSLSDVVDALTGEWGPEILEQNGDVPSVLQYGGKKRPLGRYLKHKLRERMGFHEPKTTPKGLLRKMQEKELVEIQAEAATLEKPAEVYKVRLDRRRQKARNLAARTKLYKKEKLL